jgi:thiosulfate dehydrogenase
MGNNYSAVAATYPKFRERSGTVENIYKRINDCIERSLNGQKLDSNSREILAIAAYINWLGHKVPKNTKPVGAGILDLQFLIGQQILQKEELFTCRNASAATAWGAKA